MRHSLLALFSTGLDPKLANGPLNEEKPSVLLCDKAPVLTVMIIPNWYDVTFCVSSRHNSLSKDYTSLP